MAWALSASSWNSAGISAARTPTRYCSSGSSSTVSVLVTTDTVGSSAACGSAEGGAGPGGSGSGALLPGQPPAEAPPAPRPPPPRRLGAPAPAAFRRPGAARQSRGAPNAQAAHGTCGRRAVRGRRCWRGAAQARQRASGRRRMGRPWAVAGLAEGVRRCPRGPSCISFLSGLESWLCSSVDPAFLKFSGKVPLQYGSSDPSDGTWYD